MNGAVDPTAWRVVTRSDDLRQGVQPSGHAVFDKLELLRAYPLLGEESSPLALLDRARHRAESATMSIPNDRRRELAIETAAFALRAAELIDREGRA